MKLRELEFVTPVLFLLGVIAGGVILNASFPVTRPPAIVVEGAHLGQVCAVQRDFTITLTNTTSDDIRIQDFNASCTCTKISPKELVLEQGKSKDVTLQLDLSKFADQSQPVPFDESVYVVYESAEQTSQLPFQLHANVRPVISLEPQVVDFTPEESEAS